MSQFKFEGDVSLSPKQIEFVVEVLQKRGYDNAKVTIEPVGKVDDNFVANVKRITVNNDGKAFQMIAKIAPLNEQVRSAMKAGILFQNEHVMYTKVLPTLTALEKEAGIPEEERFVYAECYGTFMDEPNEMILLEDLKLSDFSILDKHISLTDEEVTLVLKTFAKLHALSYALRYKDYEKFNSLCGKLSNAWVIEETRRDIEMFFKKFQDDLTVIVDSDYKDKVNEALTNFVESVVKNFEYDSVSRFSVIQQGDSWTNNIMFRFEDSKAVKCCIIDYQNSNQNSPVADLHYMIFNCTDYEARSKNYSDWIDFYYKELGSYLHNFGLRVNLVYPRDQLDADLKRLSKMAFALSAMLASMTMKETHENAKFKDAMKDSNSMEEIMNMNNLTLMEDTSMRRFKARLEGLIKSFVELGYL